MRRVIGLVTAICWLGAVCEAEAGIFEFAFEEVAPGVWTGIRPDSHRFPVMGNVTFVISDEGVVVFDGGGAPAMSEQVIGKIQSLTSAPVTHVVISHWHGDHSFGVYRFAEEYSNVQFVAQRFTHAAMNGSPIEYIKRYPDFIKNNLPVFKKILERGREDDGTALSASDRIEYERILQDAEEIDAEFKRARVTSPNLVFDDKLTLHSGGRLIELRRLGDGNTEGDIVMLLPEEKLVATGDLVVFPTPYAFNVPPRAWGATLTNLNDLGYQVLVPGHGAIQ